MRVAANSEPGRVARCIAKFWRVQRPSVLISITGSAQSLDISPRLSEAFCKGLVSAGRVTTAIFFTGGTASGVMRLVGDAVTTPGGRSLPLIGFTSWNNVQSNAVLEGNQGEAQPRRYVHSGDNDRDTAGLEPRHTHFILVDSGEGRTWGSEIAMRNAVTRLLESWYNVPGVLLVVQGGPNTLNTVLDAISHGTPVVVVEETGGAADLISGFHRGWDAASGESSFSTAEYEEGVWDARRAEVAQICIAEASRGLLFPIKLTGAASEGIDAAIL